MDLQLAAQQPVGDLQSKLETSPRDERIKTYRTVFLEHICCQILLVLVHAEFQCAEPEKLVDCVFG